MSRTMTTLQMAMVLLALQTCANWHVHTTICFLQYEHEFTGAVPLPSCEFVMVTL